jgi:hypothetical protein
MTVEEKSLFISEGSFLLLANLYEHAVPAWGKMDARQMLEHLKDFFDVSSERIIFPLTTPEEHLPKYREFLYSEKEFRENTKAPASVLGDEPIAWRSESFTHALTQLKESIDNFYHYFKNVPGRKTVHPVFGSLAFEEWIMLHYKHVLHHLKQFNLL